MTNNPLNKLVQKAIQFINNEFEIDENEIYSFGRDVLKLRVDVMDIVMQNSLGGNQIWLALSMK